MTAKILFITGLVFVIIPWASPPVALALGLVFGMAFTHPFRARSQYFSKILLQICVVGLGFGLNLQDVFKAGQSGFLYTLLSIVFVMVVGTALGKFLRVGGNTAFLISTGTAICGGSAIAAVGPVIEATDEEMSVSLGIVFILNSVALITFPSIGRAAGLSQEQFGLWAALAIHDTSSVVGAAIEYGTVAFAVATTVKLTRALWIAPVALLTAVSRGNRARIKLPWFIFFFLLATIVNTYLPDGKTVYSQISAGSKIGLIVTLYLIGSNISRATLKSVGFRPFVQGILLWIIAASLSLWLIYWNFIAL